MANYFDKYQSDAPPVVPPIQPTGTEGNYFSKYTNASQPSQPDLTGITSDQDWLRSQAKSVQGDTNIEYSNSVIPAVHNKITGEDELGMPFGNVLRGAASSALTGAADLMDMKEQPEQYVAGNKHITPEAIGDLTMLSPVGAASKVVPEAAAYLTPAQQKAKDIVNNVFATEGIKHEDIASAMEKAQSTGLPLTAADLAQKNVNGVDVQGRNVLGMLDAAVNKPGGGASQAAELAARMSQRKDRIGQMFDQLLSSTTKQDVSESAYNQIQNEAGPAYTKAFAANPVYSDDIKKFLNDPDIVSGIPMGMRIQRLEALGNNTPFKPYDNSLVQYISKVINGEKGTEAVPGVKNAFTGSFDKEPVAATSGTPDSLLTEMSPLETPNMRLLDAAKKGMDAKIRNETDPVTGKVTELGRALIQAKQGYLKAVDSANPDYALPRKLYSDAASRESAFARGRNFTSHDPEDIADFLHGNETMGTDGASDGEKLAYYAGMRRKLADLSSGMNDSANFGQNLWKDKYKDRIAASLPSQDKFGAMDTLMGHEQNMAKTDAVLGNSKTAPRLQFDQTLNDAGDTGLLKKAAHAVNWAMHPARAATNFGANMLEGHLKKKANKMTGDVAGEVTKLLLSKDPNAIRNLAEIQQEATPSWLNPKVVAPIADADDNGAAND